MTAAGWAFTPVVLTPTGDNYGNGLTGIETMPRSDASNQAQATSSGAVRLTYFTPQIGYTATSALTYVGSTAAGATPTLCKIGFYLVAANGDLTLAVATANTTSLWAGSATTEYVTALSASYTFIAGQRYAAATLVVTGTTAPTLCGSPGSVSSALNARAPRLSASLSGQTDLPASISSGSLTVNAVRHYVAAV